jgi:hypothetical protein
VVYVDGEILVNPGYGQNIVNMQTTASDKKTKLRNTSQVQLVNETPRIMIEDPNNNQIKMTCLPHNNSSPIFQQNIISAANLFQTGTANPANGKRVRQTSLSTSTGNKSNISDKYTFIYFNQQFFLFI